ncbi:hypothetical protein METEAL_22850 [Mesoterricola silvestris]|uniref:Uncharacterized protein n=1 Tax=Mesoterricola silvestris TaxID=2927979 RepID=A0AA48GWG2_9BACT|nr:hypothetical protein METEAL_22850 [Mesoterricola silvestris]
MPTRATAKRRLQPAAQRGGRLQRGRIIGCLGPVRPCLPGAVDGKVRVPPIGPAHRSSICPRRPTGTVGLQSSLRCGLEPPVSRSPGGQGRPGALGQHAIPETPQTTPTPNWGAPHFRRTFPRTPATANRRLQPAAQRGLEADGTGGSAQKAGTPVGRPDGGNPALPVSGPRQGRPDGAQTSNDPPPPRVRAAPGTHRTPCASRRTPRPPWPRP